MFRRAQAPTHFLKIIIYTYLHTLKNGILLFFEGVVSDFGGIIPPISSTDYNDDDILINIACYIQ